MICLPLRSESYVTSNLIIIYIYSLYRTQRPLYASVASTKKFASSFLQKLLCSLSHRFHVTWSFPLLLEIPLRVLHPTFLALTYSPHPFSLLYKVEVDNTINFQKNIKEESFPTEVRNRSPTRGKIRQRMFDKASCCLGIHSSTRSQGCFKIHENRATLLIIKCKLPTKQNLMIFQHRLYMKKKKHYRMP